MSTFVTPIPPGTQNLVRVTPSALVPALRFANDPLMWVGVPPGTPISALATGCVAVAQGSVGGLPANVAGPWTLFQLSPLPQLNPAAFKSISGGLPVQLVLVTGPPAGSSPADGDLVLAGASLVSAPSGPNSTGFMAIAFQDRLCRDPQTWAEAVGASSACDASWPGFEAMLAALPGAGHLRVLDWRGRPLTAGSVTVTVGANPPVSVALTHAMDGDTGQDVPAGAQATVDFTSAGDPVVAPGDQDDGALGEAFQLAAGARMAQLLDAAQWLAVPDAGVEVARWHDGNLVQPIQEGTPYFTQLVTDLRKAKPGGVVEFAGWAFVKGSETDDDVDWSLIPFDNSTVFLSLIKELRSADVTVGMLVNRFFQFDSPTLDDFQYLAALIFAVYLAMLPLPTLLKLQTDPAAYMFTMIAVAAAEAVLASPLTETIIKDELEFSQDFMTALAAFDATIATWTPYRAAFLDNPLVSQPPEILGTKIDDISHLGVYHQKYVNIQFPGSATPPYIAYLGGIDINSDRPDTTIHRALHPFHDVQIRLQGPAVAETIRSYAERASAHGANAPIAQPAAGQIPAAGSHIVQIARTYFRPAPGSPSTGYEFAPNGETTPVRTIKAAIAQARDFIYIEDQYFTPPDDYVQALIDAAGQGVQALFITVPYQTDQPYGGQRRTPVLDALQSSWGSRLYVGTPFRRFLHEVPVLTTNLGRLRLGADMTQGAATCSLSPTAHIPATPFWAFISGELVLVTGLSGAATGTGSASMQAVSVVRAVGSLQAPDWGAKPVPHPKGSPVLAVQVPGIYVHAKVMIIDDVFMFVGSSNINRRGLYHDGEMDSFTIPKHLRGDPANPARILRSRLMAEHAGLSPEMGQGLFADPLSAIPYFTSRPWYAGVPRQPLSFLGDEPETLLSGASVGTWVLSQVAGPIASAAMHQVWPLLVDPTTTLDPNPAATGPAYP